MDVLVWSTLIICTLGCIFKQTLELKLPELPVGYISRSGTPNSSHQQWKFLLLYFLASSPTHPNCSVQHTAYLELGTRILELYNCKKEKLERHSGGLVSAE